MWTGGEESGVEEGCGKSGCEVCVPFSTVYLEGWQWRGSLYCVQEKNLELTKCVGNQDMGWVCLWVHTVLYVEAGQWRGSLWCKQREKNVELRKGVGNWGEGCVCLSVCVLLTGEEPGVEDGVGNWGEGCVPFRTVWGVTAMCITVMWTGGEESGVEEGCGKSGCEVCVPFSTVYLEGWQWRGSLYCVQEEKNLELRKGVGGARCMCLSEQCALRRDNDVGHCTVNRRRRTWIWGRVWEVRGVCAFQNSVRWGVTMTWVTVLWTGGEEPGSEEGCGRCEVYVPFRTVCVEAWQWRGSLYCEQEEKNLELRKEGVGVILDSTLPHLIAVDDDILSTGIMLYHLKVTRSGLVPFWSDWVWLITFIQRKSVLTAFQSHVTMTEWLAIPVNQWVMCIFILKLVITVEVVLKKRRGYN